MRAAAQMGDARIPERNLLRAARRHCLEPAAWGVFVEGHRFPLVLGVARQGLPEKINHALVIAGRKLVARKSRPSAAVIGELSMPRKRISFWKSSDIYWLP